MYKKNDLLNIIFLYNNTIIFEVRKKQKKIVLTASEFSKIKQLFTANEPFKKDQLENSLYKKLKQHNLIHKISEVESKYLGTQYEKTVHFFRTVMEKPIDVPFIMKQKTILLIGLGGLGTEIIRQLAALGIRNYILVDDDIIKTENLNRQLCFSNNDVGRYKVDVISEFLQKENPGCKAKTYQQKIKKTEDLLNILQKNENVDLVINCADTPLYVINEIVLQALSNEKTPCIFGGVGMFNGTIGPLLKTRREKKIWLKKYNFINKNVEFVPNCIGSNGVTNALIATIMANEISFFLLGLEKKIKCLNKEKRFSFENYQMD